MGQFSTEKIYVPPKTSGMYSVDTTDRAIYIPIDVIGTWRSRPANGRLFSPDQIRNIRAMKANNSYRSLADLFDCSLQMIRQICLRSAYGDIL